VKGKATVGSMMIKMIMRIENGSHFYQSLCGCFSRVTLNSLKMGIGKNSRFHRWLAAVAAVAEMVCCRHSCYKRQCKMQSRKQNTKDYITLRFVAAAAAKSGQGIHFAPVPAYHSQKY
jgi:hypothetical protein